MTDRTYQVGDVVAWEEVREGWLLCDHRGDYLVKAANATAWISRWREWTNCLYVDVPLCLRRGDRVTIVDLNVGSLDLTASAREDAKCRWA